MQHTARTTSGRAPNDQTLAASFADVRPAAPKVEPASAGGIDVKAAILKRPLVAAATLLITLVAGAPYVLRKAPREYRAEATIYVSPTYFKNLQEDREQLQISYSTLVNQQILTIRRFDILSEALKRLEQQGIHWAKPGESEAAAVARLAEQLDIQHIADSYEILVGLNGEKPEWLAPIVNTIANTYLEKGKSEELADRSKGLSALSSEQTSIAAELQRKLDQQSQLSQQLMMVNLDKGAPVDDTLLAASREAREAARRKRIEAEAQLSIMEASKDANGKSALTAIAEDTVANDPNLRTFTNGLLQRSLELRSRIEGLRPEHPLRISTEKELAEINDQLTKLPQGLMKDTSSRMLSKLRADVDRYRLLESQLDQEVDARTAKVEGLAKQVQQAQGLGGDIDRLRRNQSAISGRMDELTIKDGTSGYLRIFSAAQPPIEPNKSNSKKLLGALFALALFLAAAVVVTIDLVDQRIFSPAEVKRAVGFPPVGIVMESSHGSLAFSEEHFRRLVNGIQRGIAAQGAKTVVLTSLKLARTGGLVSDIGRALVARGLSTVIIGANPLRAGEQGASGDSEDLLAVNQPRFGVIENSDPRVPARIEIGACREISQMPAIARIGPLLKQLKHEYDVIMIDAPPLWISADTEFLTSTADISLVVVETGEATRRELVQGVNLLGRIGASSIGVIMTQVRLSQAGRALKQDFKRFSSLSWSIVPEGVKS